MGWCHEFGAEIDVGCGHPMVAGSDACSCAECGTLCKGRFEGGCEAVWSRGPRLGAPGRPANYAAKAMFEPTIDGAERPNGASIRSASTNASGNDAPVNGTEAAATNGTAPLVPESASEPDADLIRHLVRLEGVITRLADQVASQYERQITMERHLGELGMVLGQLGVEVEARLELVERVLDDPAAPGAPLVPPVPEPQIPTNSFRVVAQPVESSDSGVLDEQPFGQRIAELG
jgi:hypothetical protein